MGIRHIGGRAITLRRALGLGALTAAVVLGSSAAARAQLTDPTFGENGYVTFADAPGGFDDVDVYESGPNAGKILLTGDFGDDVRLVRLLEDGTVDAGFGSGGTVTLTDAAGANSVETAIDGGGRALTASAHSVFARRGDGSPDPGFGSAGTVELSSTRPACGTEADPCTQTLLWTGVRADGTILVLGRISETWIHSIRPRSGPFVAALNPDGSIDSGYGENGIWADGLATTFAFADAAIATDGSVGLLSTQSCHGCPNWTEARTIDPAGEQYAYSSLCCGYPLRTQAQAITVRADGSLLAGSSGVVTPAPQSLGGMLLSPVPLAAATTALRNPGFLVRELLSLADGGGFAIGEEDDALALVEIEPNLMTGAAETELPSRFTEVHPSSATHREDSILITGRADAEGFVARISLADPPPSPDPPPVDEDADVDPPTEPGPTANAPGELRFDVLERRIPKTVGHLIRKGVSARVECSIDCVVHLKLIASGSAARKLGIAGVIARGERELWGLEPTRVDAFITGRVAEALTAGPRPTGKLALRAKVSARSR